MSQVFCCRVWQTGSSVFWRLSSEVSAVSVVCCQLFGLRLAVDQSSHLSQLEKTALLSYPLHRLGPRFPPILPSSLLSQLSHSPPHLDTAAPPTLESSALGEETEGIPLDPSGEGEMVVEGDGSVEDGDSESEGQPAKRVKLCEEGSGEGRVGEEGSGDGRVGEEGSGEGRVGEEGSGDGRVGEEGSGEGRVVGEEGSGEGRVGEEGSGDGRVGEEGSGEGRVGEEGSGEGRVDEVLTRERGNREVCVCWFQHCSHSL